MKSATRNRKSRIFRRCSGRVGFTLIELLVVVTIIVVLLALLAPAMEKAIYQAELAVCAANLKGVATGVDVYASQYRRHYPLRPTADNTTARLVISLFQSGKDDRTVLRPYIALKAMVDPLVGKVDIDTTQSVWVQNAYYTLWFGVRWPGYKGMLRLGDRFTWNDSGQKLELDFLASDTDSFTNQGNGRSIASHPDDKQLMFNNRGQDDSLGPNPLGGAGDTVTTYSYWDLQSAAPRGKLDLNYVRADESVLRLNGVTDDDKERDERVASVPFIHNASNWRLWRVQLPVH